MLRYDYIDTVHPLRPTTNPFIEIAELVGKGISANQLFDSFIVKALDEPTGIGKRPRQSSGTGPNQPKADLPALPQPEAHAETQLAPKQILPALRQPAVSGTAETVTHSPTHLNWPPQSSSPATAGPPVQRPSEWSLGHVQAAHDALSSHHTHQYNRVLSNQGPAAAAESGHKEKALQHRVMSERITNQNGGVPLATTQHHIDLRNHFHQNPEDEGPVPSGLSWLEKYQAHQDQSTGFGQSQMRGSVRPPAISPNVQRFQPAPLLTPGAQEEAPDFTTAAGRPTISGEATVPFSRESTRSINRSLRMINDLLKAYQVHPVSEEMQNTEAQKSLQLLNAISY